MQRLSEITSLYLVMVCAILGLSGSVLATDWYVDDNDGFGRHLGILDRHLGILDMNESVSITGAVM